MNVFPCLIAAALFATPVLAQDPGRHASVSASIGDPGLYECVDSSNAPPRAVCHDPMVVKQAPAQALVGPGKKYCGDDKSCGKPVYFVQDTWHNNVYVRQYRKHDGQTKATSVEMSTRTNHD
jgi:hypothetical protein